MANRVDNNNSSIMGLIIRIITTAIVLAVAAFLTPGFTIAGIGPVLVASLVIAIIVYLIGRFAGLSASPFGRGIAGFVITVIVLLITSKLVSGFDISLISAIIAALVIGIVDAIIPGQTSL